MRAGGEIKRSGFLGRNPGPGPGALRPCVGVLCRVWERPEELSGLRTCWEPRLLEESCITGAWHLIGPH